MKKMLSLLKKNKDSGSSMVTVIIVVAFMSILGTIALYISGANYKMKVVDAANKKSFYSAEEVVEVLKTQLTIDVATATQRATKAAGASYVEYDSVEMREEIYLKNFKIELQKVWNSHWNDKSGVPGADPINYSQAVGELFGGSTYTITNVNMNGDKLTFNITINSETLKCEINDMSSGFLYKDAIDFTSVTSLLVDNSSHTKKIPASYELKDFNVTVTDSKGFVSVINTSFKITPPSLNWDSEQVLKGENRIDYTEKIITEADYSDSVIYYNWAKE